MSEARDSLGELDTLLGKLLDSQADDATWSQLQVMLRDDPATQRDYLAFIALHSELAWTHEDAPQLSTPTAVTLATPARRWQSAWSSFYDFASNYITLSLLISAITITIIVLSMGMIVPDPKQPTPRALPSATEFVARITSTFEATWDETSDVNFKNVDVLPGEQLILNSGLAELTFDDGAVTLLEGPVVFVVASAGAGELQGGKLFANVPAEAVGFTVSTPVGKIIDLGTEFSVIVRGAGDSDVAVFQGGVEIVVGGKSGRCWPASRRPLQWMKKYR